MNSQEIIKKTLDSILTLYREDPDLFQKDLCERCLVHRLAVYLERQFVEYKVDCEFNKSFHEDRVTKKYLSNLNGNYVDIIIHKRSNTPGENLVCFEVKKKQNYTDRAKDRENLEILTRMGRFEYRLGFYILLGNTLDKTEVEIYSDSNLIQRYGFSTRHPRHI